MMSPKPPPLPFPRLHSWGFAPHTAGRFGFLDFPGRPAQEGKYSLLPINIADALPSLRMT